MWQDREGKNVTDERLANHAKAIIRKKWLIDVELMEIEARVKQSKTMKTRLQKMKQT